MKCIIRLIDNSAVTHAINAAKIDWYKLIFASELLTISMLVRIREAKIIGIDNSIENIAAEERSNPKNLAPVIVTPALLAPGIKAKIWNKPIF